MSNKAEFIVHPFRNIKDQEFQSIKDALIFWAENDGFIYQIYRDENGIVQNHKNEQILGCLEPAYGFYGRMVDWGKIRAAVAQQIIDKINLSAEDAKC